MKNISKKAMRYMLTVSMLLVALCVSAQTTVTGTVIDAGNNDPIIGASILEIGTTNGTITDFDGNFTLTVQPGAKLAISYMGYKNQELVATPSMHILMHEDSELLDEVVVVGYGVVKKNDATGSVTAIKPDEMNKALTTTATDMLAGKVAGVVVTSDGGAPGGSANIRIRGGSSLSADNRPLIVIDGLTIDNNSAQGVSNPLSLVNPADIESMTVLKDASATAIYGSRASNGVIIITTKKGKAGTKPRFTYEGNVSTSALTERVQVLTGDQLRRYANALGMGPEAMSSLGQENTDWQSLIYRTAVSTDHNFSIMGGTKHMPYRASLGYTLGNGIVKTNQMQRITASLNLAPSFLDDHLTFNLNAKGMYIYNRYADGVQGDAMNLDPTQPVYDPNNLGFGGYFERVVEGAYPDIYNHPGEIWYYTRNTMSARNPVSVLNQKKDIAHTGEFIGNLEATYKIHGFEDLMLYANFGADYSYGKENWEWSPYSAGGHYYGSYSWSDKMKYNLLFTCYAQYAKDFNEKHHFDVQLGYEWQHYFQKGTGESYGIYPETAIDPTLRGTKYNYYGTDVNYWATENYIVSFFGRANYSALNRYLFTVSLRADGSSRFHKDRRWGYFPAVAVAWKIKEEPFLRDVNWLNDLKLRFGYGITGQQNISDSDYPYMGTYDVSRKYAFSTLGELATPEVIDALVAAGKKEGVDFVISNDNYVYYYTNRPNEYNPELTWEKTTTYNVGIDFGFLNNRINGAIEYYYRITDDLINYVNVPGGTNFGAMVNRNIGQLINTGIEFTFNGVIMDRKNFKWDIGYNLAWNKNKITKLLDSDDPNYYVNAGEIRNSQVLKIHKVGYPASSFYVYRTEIDETGKRVVIDIDGDGKITSADRQIYHSPAAPVLMGLSTKFQFYGVDLGFSFRASIGNYVYNSNLSGNLTNVEKGNIYSQKSGGFYNLMMSSLHAYYVDGMKPVNYGSQFDLLDYFVEDASFLRCDNITVGYTIEKPVIKARVYCTLSNPFVISRYKGLDPEVWGGIDNNIYPRSLTVTVGTSLNF